MVRLTLRGEECFAAAGLAAGTFLALAASHWPQPLLFEQSAKDPVIYLGVGTILLLVAVAACVSPTLRAARADSNAVLRTE